MDYEFHEAANIFPLDEKHIPELAEDIRQNGLELPIELCDGLILDGRRRYLACEQAGVEPQFIEVEPDDPVRRVLTLNLHRRHLSVTQLAMVAARAREIYDRQAKERQKDHGKTAPGKAKTLVVNLPQVSEGKARDKAGEAVGVSGSAVDQARRVLNNCTAKLIAAVDEDKVSVSYAARMSKQSPEKQDEIADKSGEKKKRKRPAAEADKTLVNGEDATEKQKLKGIACAHEAIECLKRIPKNDSLRKRCFQVVTDWIRHNK